MTNDATTDATTPATTHSIARQKRLAIFALALLAMSACDRSRAADTTTTPPDAPAPVLLPVPGDPTVSFSVWFQVGAQDDPPGKEGLAWLTGELIEEGSTQQQSYEQIVAALYPMATEYSVRVDREMTTVRGTVHRDHLPAFLRLYTQAYLSPAFTDSDFARVRARGLDYLTKTLRYTSDEELGKAALDAMVYDGTRYRHPITGTVAGLRSITRDDVEAFYRAHYTRDRVVFALGGGYDVATVEAVTATRAQLPAPENAAAQPPPPSPAAIDGRRVAVVVKPGADASISIGFPIDVHRGEREFYALWVATSWLGEHRNSSGRLYGVIRAQRGLNYGDYAYIEAFPEGGFRQMPPTNVARRQQMFEMWIRTLPNDKAVFALRAALRELRLLVERGLDAEDFELRRAFLRKYIRHFAPDTATRLGYAVDDRFYGIDGGHLDRFVKMMDELTLDEVNAAIRKHLQYENLAIAIVTGEPDAIRAQLTGGAASAIEYPVPKPDAVLATDKEIGVEPLAIDAGDITAIPVDQIFER